jgi:hypothetical protein
VASQPACREPSSGVGAECAELTLAHASAHIRADGPLGPVIGAPTCALPSERNMLTNRLLVDGLLLGQHGVAVGAPTHSDLVPDQKCGEHDPEILDGLPVG